MIDDQRPTQADLAVPMGALQACWTTGSGLFSGSILGKPAFRQTIAETPEEQTAPIITGNGGIRSNNAICS
jgi:hypothetical protein